MRDLRLTLNVLMICTIAVMIGGCATLFGKKADEKPIDTVPMYGQPQIPRPDKLKQADAEFIENAVRMYGSREKASQAWAKVGNDIYETGKYDEAMRRYNQSWLLNENNYQPYWGFGQIMGAQGKIDDAIKYYEKAKALIDDYYQKPALLTYLGITYSHKARYITNNQEARARYFAIANGYFKESAELDKNYPDVWESWANSLFIEGKYAEAWDKVKKADAMGHPVQQRFREGLRKVMPEPD